MSIYAISDLHLSFGTNKSMQIFGPKWFGYEERLQKNWDSVVKADDYVLIPGDLSWATYLPHSLPDLRFLNSLNGKKIISRGNHDYWWGTLTQNNKFCNQNNLSSLYFIHNSALVIEDNNLNIAICGTRGWTNLGNADSEDIKIYKNECRRMQLSLDKAKQHPKFKECYRIIAMLHYPPDSVFHNIMSQYDVDICIFGHLHHATSENEKSILSLNATQRNIDYHLVSADFLQFTPKLII